MAYYDNKRKTTENKNGVVKQNKKPNTFYTYTIFKGIGHIGTVYDILCRHKEDDRKQK